VTSVAIELPVISAEAARVPIVTDQSSYIDRVIPALDPELRFSALAVPNAHIVTIVDEYDEERLIEVGRRMEAGRGGGVLPDGANVSFLKPLSADEVFVRTFERGAGLTPSCGSAAVASRSVYSLLTGIAPERRVVIRNAGGAAASWIQVTEEGWRPVLEGNATDVFAADLVPAELLAGKSEVTRTASVAETRAFARFSEANRAALSAAGIKIG
jgi:diaminopimelate epimerase